MMKNITQKIFAACMFAVLITTAARAQIVLHEATDITQTKATLSADFPDFSVGHGFQYKYGTLPEIDDFSKLALSSHSDPVQINTGSNAWSARTAKGWVESKSNLAVGQASVMSTTVNFQEPTNVTFEWSVDSEEGIGLLSFIVDGNTVSEISGAVNFTTVSYQVTAGEHTLQWQYKKTAATNVGLDLGMVRNIDLQNTTEGEWIFAGGKSIRLENLNPGTNYIYRAYSSSENSSIKEYATLPVTIESTNIASLTQTTASFDMQYQIGDADVIYGLDYIKLDDFTEHLLSSDAIVPGITVTPNNYIDSRGVWEIVDGVPTCHWVQQSNPYGPSYYGSTIKIEFTLKEAGTISFNYSKSGNNGYLGLYVDTELEGSVYKSFYYSSGTYSFTLGKGTHTLEFKANAPNKNSANAVMKVWNLNIENIEDNYSKGFNWTGQAQQQVSVQNLRPNTSYFYRQYLKPKNHIDNDLDSTYVWHGTYMPSKRFTTSNLYATTKNLSVLSQGSATIEGTVDGGDATIIATGLQYKDATGTRWTDYPKDVTEKDLSQNITRLKPNTTYHYRSYIQAQDCDTVFSEIGEFTTLAVEPLKPTIVRLAQHEAELQGKVRFGDATIYQRGMQFRKSGETEWEEVEDGGNDSIYTLVKKNLEMGTTYEARTYIQPAGCDILYSDILQFTTRDNYFIGLKSGKRTQTSVTFYATLADIDEGVTVEEYGFEYYLESDGFFENAESFIKSDVVCIPVTPENGEITTTITGLTPQYGLRFRAYTKINGEYTYYTSYKNWTWDHAGTDRATINISVKELTQTSVTLELDATQDGDAIVTQMEYAFASSVQDTQEYQVCGNVLTIKNLHPDTKYNLRFRGTVNGRLCPLIYNQWDYSWFEFTTQAVTIAATFNDITQTKATMKLYVNAGDAEVRDLKYSLNNGEYIDCDNTVKFNGLTPGTQYTITFMGKVNDWTYQWNGFNSADKYIFTTKSVSVDAYSTAIEQTSAIIHRSYNCGDATYVSSGIEYGTTAEMTESISANDTETRLTELTPNTTYYWRFYVETAEGGKVYTNRNTFNTTAISCTTLPVSNISNRSATMNGTIDCDSYSSAEFGFQWKQMEGWNSEPAFTKGVKKEDGTIAVTLVNGMLEPNTDYQYRAAVRYKGNIYYAIKWETFRTESEFVYYPASVYTMYRTDRENNCLVLCGYYVAGSENVVTQGYEYWNNAASARTSSAYAPGNVMQITTDESMQYNLDLKTLVDGNYSVRAFVKTSSGTTIYGETLTFGVQDGNITDIDHTVTREVGYTVSRGVLSIHHAARLTCIVYNLQGQTVESRLLTTDHEQFRLVSGTVYIVRLSNGMTWKISI